ncbi:MAG TPA: serine/threonine-protein kinase, partial [Candidatus Acidoferrum sp.]|nr:serine/threonine-protein kinase [Candidatus Acidoferrum sp.]
FEAKSARAGEGLEPPGGQLDAEPPPGPVAETPVGGSSLAAGQRLGSYEVLSLLGKGGMGEVYLAHDMRLDRQVALKVLPLEVTQEPERLRRFVQEARAASALNHPNIATIHEIGQAGGLHFIVMEYIAGETLAERIRGRVLPSPGAGDRGHPRHALPPGRRGQESDEFTLAPDRGRGSRGEGARPPLTTTEILDIGIQVADALEEAHAHGITHRDIKPANIMLTPRGLVKVLDFGLAKRTHSAAGPAVTSVDTESETTPGMIMGTVDYMSPEQVLGQEVDLRTDLFSLGVVLYGMTTGRSPFSGTSPTDTIGKILHTQPQAMVSFNPSVPAELE